MCTFIFVSIVLTVKDKFTTHSKDGALLALAVVTVLFGLIQVANHHAASFNPCVSVALTIFQVSVLENTGGYLTHYFYAYFLGPYIGGIIAGLWQKNHPLITDQKEQAGPAGLPPNRDDEAGLVNGAAAQ